MSISQIDRYANAAKWFEHAGEKYPIAEIYCDISSCLELINQYNGSKIKQTEQMYQEYKNLWNMINELKTKADGFDGLDAKIQVWKEIDGMINSNVIHFLEVTEKKNMSALLTTILNESKVVDKAVLEEDINALQESIQSTIRKIDSAQS